MVVGLDLYMIDDPDTRIYYVQLLQKMDEEYLEFWYANHGPKEKSGGSINSRPH